MRAPLIFLLAALPFTAEAASKKVKPAVIAEPSGSPSKPRLAGGLIDSDLNGRDFTFLSGAMQLGAIFRQLASHIPRTANPALRGFGEDLVKTLSAQGAVLNTVAEMRRLKIPETPSPRENFLTEKLGKLDGVKLQKVLLDSFREADRQALATYEAGAQSDDVTIRNLSTQTLPQIRQHLAMVEAMIGIAPKPHPAFRSAVRPPAEPER